MTRVLIIDDRQNAQVDAVTSVDPLSRTIKPLLKEGGYDVYTTTDISEANEVLTDHGCEHPPAVVVADVTRLHADSPNVKGLLEQVHELDEHIPLVIITNEPDTTAAAKATHLGAYDYVAKPIKPGRLMHTIGRAVDRKHLLDEIQRLRARKQVNGTMGEIGWAPGSTRWPSTANLEEIDNAENELRTLTRIGQEVSAELDLNQVLERVTQLAADICGAHRCTIVLISDEGKMSMPTMSAFSDGHRDEEMWRLFMDKGYPVPLVEIPEAQQVIREQSPLFIADATASSLPRHLIEPFGIKSVLLVPLISKKWVVGLMALDHIEEGHRFTARQVDMATSIAAQATLAIENARLYEQARRRARYGTLLSMVAQQANTMVEPERLLPTVAKTIHEHFRYDSVILMRVDAESGELTIGGKAGIETEIVPDDYRQTLDQGIMGWVARHGECKVSNDARQEERYFAPFPDHYQAGSELAVPLRSEGEVVGVLDLQCQERGSFDELDISTARTLAEQIGTALQNARLYREEQRHVEVLTALRNIDLTINSTLSLDAVLKQVYEQLSGLMDITTFYIGLYDKRKDEIHLSLIVDRGNPLDPLTLDLQGDSGFAGWVVRNKEPLWIEHWDREQETLPVKGIPRGKPTQSLMLLPLLARDELIGVISAQSYEPYAFDEDDQRLFSGISNQVAIAVENARLFEEVNRRLREMRLLQKIILAASSTLDFDEVLDRTIETLQNTLGIEHIAFALPDEDGSSMIVHPSTAGPPSGSESPGSTGEVALTPWRLPMDDSIMGRAYRTGEALLFTAVSDVSSSLDGAPANRTELAVPVWDGDEVVAVLNAESPLLKDFDEDDLSLFSAVAAQLGVVLRNARLFEQTRRRLTETRLLQQVMQAGAISLDFDQVLERTVDALHSMLGIKHLSFALPVEDEAEGSTTTLRMHPSQIGYAPEMTEVRIPLDRSVAGRAYLTGETQLIGDVRETPIYFEGAPGVLSELNVPVKVAGHIIAVLNAESTHKNAFDDDDLRLFQAVAAQLGIVLENARLYQKLQIQRDKLSQAYDELKEIDRLRAELVQNVSHELRTPFTLVQGYIELLMAGDLGPLSEKQREALMIIRKRVRGLERRTRDLTTLDKLSRGETKAKPTCVLEATRCAAANLRTQAHRAGVRLTSRLPDALPPVMADREHLVQAFTHLVDNAIKFSPDGGTVILRAWEDNDHSCVAVEDEGIGIRQEHLDQVFERFYQVDGSINRRFGGMGIGLALVWEIVEVYGGYVDVRSSPQTGSTFIVSLPQAPPTMKGSEAARSENKSRYMAHTESATPPLDCM